MDHCYWNVYLSIRARRLYKGLSFWKQYKVFCSVRDKDKEVIKLETCFSNKTNKCWPNYICDTLWMPVELHSLFFDVETRSNNPSEPSQANSIEIRVNQTQLMQEYSNSIGDFSLLFICERNFYAGKWYNYEIDKSINLQNYFIKTLYDHQVKYLYFQVIKIYQNVSFPLFRGEILHDAVKMRFVLPRFLVSSEGQLVVQVFFDQNYENVVEELYSNQNEPNKIYFTRDDYKKYEYPFNYIDKMNIMISLIKNGPNELSFIDNVNHCENQTVKSLLGSTVKNISSIPFKTIFDFAKNFRISEDVKQLFMFHYIAIFISREELIPNLPIISEIVSTIEDYPIGIGFYMDDPAGCHIERFSHEPFQRNIVSFIENKGDSPTLVCSNIYKIYNEWIALLKT